MAFLSIRVAAALRREARETEPPKNKTGDAEDQKDYHEASSSFRWPARRSLFTAGSFCSSISIPAINVPMNGNATGV